MATRASVLADRVKQGAENLISAVENLTDAQWQTPCGDERRSVGVLVHHVGTMYPVEASVAKQLAETGGLPGVDWAAVDGINAEHAANHATPDKAETIAMVRENVRVAVDAVNALSDADLDRLAPNALAWNAPMTVQNFVENHPIAHPYIHLESIRAALG
jgi:hypothetical protein